MVGRKRLCGKSELVYVVLGLIEMGKRWLTVVRMVLLVIVMRLFGWLRRWEGLQDIYPYSLVVRMYQRID